MTLLSRPLISASARGKRNEEGRERGERVRRGKERKKEEEREGGRRKGKREGERGEERERLNCKLYHCTIPRDTSLHTM